MEGVAIDIVKQSGIAGVFIFSTFIIYKDSRKQIDKKDEDIKELNGKVLEAFKENAIASMKLSESIDKNNEIMRVLNGRVYNILKK